MSSFSFSRSLKTKREQGGENCEIGRDVSGETPMLAGMTETAAGDVETANFCTDRGNEEDHNKRSQNR